MAEQDLPEGFEDPDAPDAEPVPEPEPPPVAEPEPEWYDVPEEGVLPADGDEEPSSAEEPEPEQPEPPKEFPEEHKQAFTGLMHIGRLVDSVDAYGHEIIIQTLTMEQMLVAGLIHTKYRGTLGDTRAWQAATLAGAVQSVDGKALPMPVEDVNTETLMRDRFRYIIQHWFPPTVDLVYSSYLELEGQVEEVLRSLGEASG